MQRTKTFNELEPDDVVLYKTYRRPANGTITVDGHTFVVSAEIVPTECIVTSFNHVCNGLGGKEVVFYLNRNCHRLSIDDLDKTETANYKVLAKTNKPKHMTKAAFLAKLPDLTSSPYHILYTTKGIYDLSYTNRHVKVVNDTIQLTISNYGDKDIVRIFTYKDVVNITVSM